MIFFEFAPVKTTRGHAYKLYKPRCSNVRVVEVWNKFRLAESVLRVCLLLSPLSALLILLGFWNMCRFRVLRVFLFYILFLLFFFYAAGCECVLLRALLAGSHCVLSRYMSSCTSWANKDDIWWWWWWWWWCWWSRRPLRTLRRWIWGADTSVGDWRSEWKLLFNRNKVSCKALEVSSVRECPNAARGKLFHRSEKNRTYYLFSVVFHPEGMQCEPRDLENPAIVHVTVGAGQVTMRLEHRLVQVDRSLST